MAGGIRARWRLAAVAVLALLGCGCGSAPARPAGGADLAEGPTRWLMLPEEERQLRRLHTTREAVDFIEAFWRRRDPDPGTPGNEFSRTFYERVEAADRLYGEGGTRGSLTDRGRALILLGPPPVLRYSQRKVPAWDPGRSGAPSVVHSHLLPLESWVYKVEELEPAVRRLVAEEVAAPEIVLAFVSDPRRTYLIEGEEYLKMAVRASVRR